MNIYKVIVTVKIKKNDVETYNVLIIKYPTSDTILYEKDGSQIFSESIKTQNSREEQIKEIKKTIKQWYTFKVETQAWEVVRIK